MQKAKIEIEGVKPIIIHKFNIEQLQALSKPKAGSAGNNPEEWKETFFHKDGKLYVPSNYIFSALKNGSVHTKAGRGTIQKTWISAITIEEDILFFNREMFANWEECLPQDIPKDPNLPVYIHVCMVSNPNTKGKNARYRVSFSPGWKLNFTLLIDDSLVSTAQVKKVVEDTGKMQGLADARTLGYGRFKVNSCEFSKI